MDVAILKDIIKETDKNWRFIFESPLYPNLNYVSGQLVQLVAKPGEEDSVVRNYSISSWANGTNEFELIITYLEGGAMSEYLFKEAKIGDEFVYRGPMGMFVLPEIIDRDVYMVCTGSGISPFRSMINSIAKNKIPTKNIKLFFGTRTEDDLLYREELERLQEEVPNFEYIPTLSRQSIPGIAEGYVHSHYLDLVDNLKEKPLFYFCGWRGMIDEGRSHLSERNYELGKDIRIEVFG